MDYLKRKQKNCNGVLLKKNISWQNISSNQLHKTDENGRANLGILNIHDSR